MLFKKTSIIYKYFLKMDKIFFPKIIKEKITPQDTERQKGKLNLIKLKAQIREERTTLYTRIYQVIYLEQ